MTIGRAASHLLWHLTGLLPRLEAERRKVGVQSGSDPSRSLRSPSGARRVTLVSIITLINGHFDQRRRVTLINGQVCKSEMMPALQTRKMRDFGGLQPLSENAMCSAECGMRKKNSNVWEA